LTKYFNNKYAGTVSTNYVKYSQRFDKEWDYAIFPARYVRGPHLRAGTWPSSRTLFTISANGVPLTAVLKADGKAAFLGQQAIKNKQFPEAIQYFQQEIQAHPDDEIAWLGLANAQINSQQPGQAIQSAEKVLEIVPENLQALSFLGLAKLNTGDPAGAKSAFEQTIELDKNYSGGYYYLALIAQAENDIQSALNYVEQAIRTNPKFKAGYDLAARLLEQSGNPQRAQELRRQAQSIQ
ncbi:MAG: tetratricopeptide repeat protein, partial [Phaeodactylibacter sp.]|nr:tetratricopeptide repeat protein [Phaeodactylibacter sp.]